MLAIVKDGMVVDVLVVDGDFGDHAAVAAVVAERLGVDPPVLTLAPCADDVGVGFSYADGSFPPPPLPPPDVPAGPTPLQRYQFLAMLDIAGLKDKTDAAIAAIADPVQRAVARAKFDSMQTFERDDPLLVALATAAGLSSDQVDEYWTQAAGL